MKTRNIILLMVVSFLFSCAAPPVKMSSGAFTVKVAKSDPPDNYTEIGPITAIDDEGCGGFGYRSTYDSAIII